MDTPIKKPRYKMQLSDDTDTTSGVQIMSLVGLPANETSWLTFSKIKPTTQVKFSLDTAKQVIMGVALIPDQVIDRGEYEVVMDAQAIEDVAIKFFKDQKSANVDLDHSGMLVDNVTLYQSIIKSADGFTTLNPAFSDLPDGTWLLSYKVNDPAIWQQITDGYFTGFSIAGMLQQIPVEQTKFSKQPSNLEIFKQLQEVFKDY